MNMRYKFDLFVVHNKTALSLSAVLAYGVGGVSLQAGEVDPEEVLEGALAHEADLVLAQDQLIHLEPVLGVVVRHLRDHVVGQVYQKEGTIVGDIG
jgi:hypothetical protein